MARAMKDSGISWIGMMPNSWSLHRMKGCIVDRISGAWGSDPVGDDGDIICLRIADFDYSRFIFRDVPKEKLTVRNYDRETIERLCLQKGDILIEKSGGGEKTPVGRTVVFDKNFPALFANFMDRVRCADFVCSDWLQYVFVTFYKNEYSRNYIKQTTGIQNLDLTSLFANERIPVPSLAEQSRIAAFLDEKCAAIDALIEQTSASIEEYKKLKQAVITQAVTKGIRPNRKMKDSEIDEVGDIPEDWNIRRLKYLMTEIVDCPHETPEYSNDGVYYVIRTADQDYAQLRPNGAMYRLNQAEYENRIRRLSLDKDDIVYGREGERWGLACIVPESGKYCLGQRMMQFRCNRIVIIPQFAVYALSSSHIHRQGEFDTFGSTSPHVNISTIQNYSLPLPSLAEQEELCNYIAIETKKIDALTNTKEQLVSELESYKKSLIFEYVTGKKEVPA